MSGALGDARQLMSALRGDRNAALQIARRMVPRLREPIEDARSTIHDKHATEWDREARRREAFDGQVDPATAAGAASAIYEQVIGITHLIPLVLAANGEEQQVYEEKLAGNVYSLVVMLHNPTIRYALVGTLDPAVRQDVDHYLSAIGREVWGTLLAITSDGEIDYSDFPQDTASILQDLAESLAQQQQGQGAD